MLSNQAKPTLPQAKKDEKILVVQRRHLFSTMSAFNGFRPLTDFSLLQKLVTDHQEFHWRSTMENNSSYKQIIPYLVFEFEGTYFIMQRRSTASEQRLKNKYSLGIGGHIREEDLTTDNLIDWAQREFDEEVDYQGKLTTTPLGLINDETDSVGQVHVGFVFLLHGNSPQIAIRAEHKEGHLISLKDCQPIYDELESWSKLVYDHLKGY